MKDEVMGWNTNWVCLSWIHRQHHKLGNQEKKRNGNDPVPGVLLAATSYAKIRKPGGPRKKNLSLGKTQPLRNLGS